MVDNYDAFSNEYIDCKVWNEITAHKSEISRPETLLRGFWGALKYLKGNSGGRDGRFKIFITGVFSLADHTSDFNIQTNISFDKAFAGFCGLTEDEVKFALGLMGLVSKDVATHVAEVVKNSHGYHFCDNANVPTVFNMNTCLEYFQVSI